MSSATETNPLRKALQPAERLLWEDVNAGLPWDISIEEAYRVVTVKGRARLCEADLAARALRVAA